MAAPVDLYRDEVATFTRDGRRRVVEQRWMNLAMSEQQFRDRISKLATFLEQARVPNVLVDMAVISHTRLSYLRASQGRSRAAQSRRLRELWRSSRPRISPHETER